MYNCQSATPAGTDTPNGALRTFDIRAFGDSSCRLVVGSPGLARRSFPFLLEYGVTNATKSTNLKSPRRLEGSWERDDIEQ